MPPKFRKLQSSEDTVPFPPLPSLCWLLLSVIACQTGGCSFSLLTHKVWERDGRKQRERESGEWSQREELLSLLLVVIVATAAS